MYEVHQREWNSGTVVAIIFKSDNLEECRKFAKAWNNAMDKLYEGKNIDDECCHFASTYDVFINEYIYI